MLWRSLTLLGLLGLAVLPSAAPAADAPKAPAVKPTPTMVVRVRSIEGLLTDANYLIELAGEDEQAKQFSGLVKSMIGKKGLEGVDAAKPIGLYVFAGADGDDTALVGLIPVADEASVLSLLERIDVKATPDKDGFYNIKPKGSPVPLVFRFSQGYMCVSTGKGPLAKDRLLNPADVLPTTEKGAVVVTLRLGKIPQPLKEIALTEFETRIKDEEAKKEPNESDKQHKLKMAILTRFFEEFRAVVKDGDEVTLRFDVDRKSGEVFTDAEFTAKPKSKLADEFAALGKSQSVFAGITANAAMSFLAHAALPDQLRDAFGPVWDEGFAKALEQEKDADKKAQAEKFMEVVIPTVKAGELDLAVALQGPGQAGKYALLVGVKVKNGLKIDATARELIEKFAKEEEKGRIKFDVEKVGTARIHQLDVQKSLDSKAKALLGDEPLYLGVRDDLMLLGLGEGSLEAVKTALAADPKAAPLEMTLALKRLAPAMALEEKTKDAAAWAEKAFGAGEGTDRVRITLEGGKSLKVRFTVKGDAIKFAVGMARAAQEKAAQ